MTQHNAADAAQFQALHEIALDGNKLARIKQNVLLPFLQEPALLGHYAAHIVQEQNQLLTAQGLATVQGLSDTIAQLIARLNASDHYLAKKRYNRLQRWLGIELEQQASAAAYLNQFNDALEQASQLSHQVAAEVYQSAQKFNALMQLRLEMAHFIMAAQQFLHEMPTVSVRHPTWQNDAFRQRLQKKIDTLWTAQTATDMAMLQIQLSQQVALSILDRFSEAKNVLIPAWRQYILGVKAIDHSQQLEKINLARANLLQMLEHARQHSGTASHDPSD